MKQNLTLILMNEAVREGWREWMEKVRRVLPQTDAERPVTWIAAERLARENGRMVRLVELLREHRPVLSYRVKEEAGLLILPDSPEAAQNQRGAQQKQDQQRQLTPGFGWIMFASLKLCLHEQHSPVC